jgi:hypothetical protein
VSVVFVNLQGLVLGASEGGDVSQALQLGQGAMLKVQAAVHHAEGQARAPHATWRHL